MIGQKGVPATYGGIERHVEEIARRLGSRGHQVDVFCRLYYTPGGTTLPAVRMLRRPSIHTKHLDTATHVAWCTLEAMARRYDIVHFHALGPSLFASALAVLAYNCFPDRTIVVSKTLREYFQQHHHRDTCFIPNGTNLLPARPAKKILQLGLTPGKYVLFVGRLVPEKGVHFLCEAFSRIDSDMKLALVGGLSFSQEYVALLKRYEGERIRLLDYVFGEALEELWSNAYLVVQPSTMEGLSIALLEAMSYGRCVLLSDIPENLEVAEDCAVPFRSQNVDDLHQKLESLIRHPETVRAYEARARNHIMRHYSWDQVAENTEAVYREALARR